MIDAEWAREFAKEWIEGWNSHDLDRIMSHYSDDFEMSSPLIIQLDLDASGTLKGKNAVRDYWQKGLARSPSLKFELIEVLTGVNSITLYYRRHTGNTAAEVLFFNEQRQVNKGAAHYGS
jgi:ketosteroid isomerase-like protein